MLGIKDLLLIASYLVIVYTIKLLGLIQTENTFTMGDPAYIQNLEIGWELLRLGADPYGAGGTLWAPLVLYATYPFYRLGTSYLISNVLCAVFYVIIAQSLRPNNSTLKLVLLLNPFTVLYRLSNKDLLWRIGILWNLVYWSSCSEPNFIEMQPNIHKWNLTQSCSLHELEFAVSTPTSSIPGREVY